MRTRTIITAVVGAGLLLTGAMAQQEEHQNAMCGNTAEMTCCNSMPGMTAPGMTGMMPQMMPMMHQMMADNGETAKLLDQVVNSFAAIQAEKDPVVIKQKLAEQGALLKELQAKLQAQTQTMQQRMGPMMGQTMRDAEPKR